ncbi:MAG TPA: PBP1A family penicillin-binding protein, partial [Patescibacteria group bacterium]|nr:PBP1A family penicillin-binding protein [Patescibacteria group bacterium]
VNIMKNNNQGLTLLDDRGNEFFSFYSASSNKDYVDYDNISNFVKEAAIASEDREFYSHHGFSLRGIARSVVLDYQNKSLAYGGSTITQQLAKNTLLSQNRDFTRKFQELILAIELENEYSKKDILEMYLNSAYFGEGAFGIEDAAKTYFNKDAKDLTLGEASYLIGILPSPSTMSAFSGNRALGIQNQELVIDEMKEMGDISSSQANLAKGQELHFNKTLATSNADIIAPHFALAVKNALVDKYGEAYVAKSGFVVKTTLNRNWQEEAENVVDKNAQRLLSNGGTNEAVVVIDPKSGQVKAMVGSNDWNNSKYGKFNMAMSPRQPGSSFKPIVYGMALEDEKITPATVLSDRPTTFKMTDCTQNCSYSPKDYDRMYRGDVTVRRALSNSLNIPAVEVMEQVGVDDVLNKAPQVGITSLGTNTHNYGYSLVLGTGSVSLLEMTGAYSSFANKGEFVKPSMITAVIDKRGNNIWKQDNGKNRVWSPEVAFLISSILSDNKTRAEEFGSSLTIDRPAAVKTGTTDSFRDAWTMGYTPDVVVGVWVGNNNNMPMNNVAGSLGAAPIWRELMEYYNRGVAIKQFSPPQDIVRLPPCSKSISTGEYFIEGTEPSNECFSTPRFAEATSSGDLIDENNISSDTNGDFPGVGGGPPTEIPQETISN